MGKDCVKDGFKLIGEGARVIKIGSGAWTQLFYNSRVPEFKHFPSSNPQL